jgi:hypothetical protein
MNASVEPDSGPPGQLTTLQTQGVAGAYDGLAQSGSISIYLVDPGIADAAVCDTAHAHLLGSLSWDHGVGRLAFAIPAIPAGSYSFRALVPDSGCWVIGGDGSTLALRVDAQAESDQTWLAALAVVVSAGIGLLVIRLRMRS